MQRTDPHGLDMTTDVEESARAHDELVRSFVNFDADITDRLRASFAADGAPLNTILLGHLMAGANTAPELETAAGLMAKAESLDLNPRERAHLEALRLAIDDDYEAVVAAWRSILERWPTDLVALQMLYMRLFSRGRVAEMLEITERARDQWDADSDRQSYLLGMTGFALEEMGEYDEAEARGRAAVEANPTDLWSIHCVAHVHEMVGKTDEALAWFEGRDDELHRHGAFARHLWWHHALIHFRTGNTERMLELYDVEVQPGVLTDTLSLTNAIDLLARLEFAGVDVGDRWDPLVPGSRHRIGHHTHPFSDAHFAYALERAGAGEDAAELLASMEAWRDRATSSAALVDEVGLETARGMAALGRGRRFEALAALDATAATRWKLGGSHAQRRVFDLAQAAASID